jgi:hypothetical protein
MIASVLPPLDLLFPSDPRVRLRACGATASSTIGDWPDGPGPDVAAVESFEGSER